MNNSVIKQALEGALAIVKDEKEYGCVTVNNMSIDTVISVLSNLINEL